MNKTRELQLSNNKPWITKVFRWETLLALILVLLCLGLKIMEPEMVSFGMLIDNSMSFIDKGVIVLSMMLILVLGEIDISVGSTACLSAVCMAELFNSGVPFEIAMVLALVIGLICGLINGFFITFFKELAPMIVTLATMTIYRGIAYIILGDQASGGFPTWFSNLGWGYLAPGLPIPINLTIFLVLAVIFYIVIHHTALGKRIFAIGTNPVASEYNGINVRRIKLGLYTLNGVMSALGGIFLLARLASARPNIAEGYELDVIAICVLGGISTAGGKGSVVGAVLSVFLMGYLRYGMNIINVPGQIMPMVIGLLLIIVLVIPNLVEDLRTKQKLKRQKQNISSQQPGEVS